MTSMAYVQYLDHVARLAEQITGILLPCEEVRDKLDVLRLVAVMVAPSLDEGEVQEYLCDLATDLEVTAGRASPGDSAWVSISMISR